MTYTIKTKQSGNWIIKQVSRKLIEAKNVITGKYEYWHRTFDGWRNESAFKHPILVCNIHRYYRTITLKENMK